jgi:hypothetical protein
VIARVQQVPLGKPTVTNANKPITSAGASLAKEPWIAPRYYQLLPKASLSLEGFTRALNKDSLDQTSTFESCAGISQLEPASKGVANNLSLVAYEILSEAE